MLKGILFLLLMLSTIEAQNLEVAELKIDYDSHKLKKNFFDFNGIRLSNMIIEVRPLDNPQFLNVIAESLSPRLDFKFKTEKGYLLEGLPIKLMNPNIIESGDLFSKQISLCDTTSSLYLYPKDKYTNTDDFLSKQVEKKRECRKENLYFGFKAEDVRDERLYSIKQDLISLYNAKEHILEVHYKWYENNSNYMHDFSIVLGQENTRVKNKPYQEVKYYKLKFFNNIPEHIKRVNKSYDD